MQAVILAGGRGERLRPLTDTVPKPLLQVNGKPFAEYLVKALADAGAKEIVFCIGYLAEQFPRHFGNGSKWGVEISYSVEEVPLGTGGALKRAGSLLEEAFLLLNGDTYLPVNYERMFQAFAGEDLVGMIAAVDAEIAGVQANLSIDDKGIIRCYNKLGKAEGLDHVDAGVSVFSRRVLGYICPDGLCSLEQEVLPLLIGEKKLGAFRVRTRFWDMGTLSALNAMSEVLK